MEYPSTSIDPSMMFASLCIVLILLVTFDCNLLFIIPLFAIMLVVWINMKKYVETNNMKKSIKRILKHIKRDLYKFLSFKEENLMNTNNNKVTHTDDNDLYKLICNDDNYQLTFI